MAKVKVFEKDGDEVREHLLDSVDAREALEFDPKRYSYEDPRARKKDRDPNAGPAVPRYKVEHVGNKKFNVIDTSNDAIVESGLDEAAARAKAAELGGGHATTSPNT